MIAMTSGTTAATTAPKATSRMRNVSGIVSRSDASSPPLTSSSMSSLASVPSSEWIRSSGWAARSSSMNDRSAASRASSASPSPGTSGAMRTVERSADVRPASGGARRGSTTFANSGSLAPSTSAVAAVDAGQDVVQGCVGERAVRGADDDERPVDRILGRRAGRIEHVVCARRFERRLVLAVVVDGIGGQRSTGREARHEQADREHHPQREDEPAVARTPGGNPDGPRLAHRLGPRSPASAQTRSNAIATEPPPPRQSVARP